jgi:hypothetical protein
MAPPRHSPRFRDCVASDILGGQQRSTKVATKSFPLVSATHAGLGVSRGLARQGDFGGRADDQVRWWQQRIPAPRGLPPAPACPLQPRSKRDSEIQWALAASVLRHKAVPRRPGESHDPSQRILRATLGVFVQPGLFRAKPVPVDNFYEWAKTATGKQPYAIALADRGLMALAGLWETWRSPAGEWVRSFAIITTTPNELCAELHNRMPVVLSPDVWVGVVGRGTSRPSTSKGPARSLPRGGDGLLARKYPGRKREEQRCEPDRARCSQPVMQSQTVHE